MNENQATNSSFSSNPALHNRLHFGRAGGVFALFCCLLCVPVAQMFGRSNMLIGIGSDLQPLSLLFVPWMLITTLFYVRFTRRWFDPALLSIGLFGAPMLIFLWLCDFLQYFLEREWGKWGWLLKWLRSPLSELSAWPFILASPGFCFPLLFLAILLHKRIDRIYESRWVYGIFFLLPVFYLLFGSIALLA